MVRPRGMPSAGRQKIEIRRIDDEGRRQVTFSKRKNGIFKKASELNMLCGAQLAVVIFSPSGRSYAFGDPSVDHVLRRYLPRLGEAAPLLDDDAVSDPVALAAMWRAVEVSKAQVGTEKARMDAIAAKLVQGKTGMRFWWEADVEALGEAELSEFIRALEQLKDNVRRRADKLSAQPPQQRRRLQ